MLASPAKRRCVRARMGFSSEPADRWVQTGSGPSPATHGGQPAARTRRPRTAGIEALSACQRAHCRTTALPSIHGASVRSFEGKRIDAHRLYGHSGSMPAAFAAASHFSVSDARNWRNCSSVPAFSSLACARLAFRTSGCCCAVTSALFSLSTSAYVPSSSPTGLRPSTRSQTALTIIRIGTPSSRPQMPHSQPHTSTPTNTATGLSRLARLVSQGVSM